MSIRMLRKESVLVVRSLDYARDDSGAVNSLSTPLHFGRNDDCVGRHDGQGLDPYDFTSFRSG